MQRSVKTALAGVAVVGAVALATGAATPATARDDNSHALLVQLPDGALEQIEYTGPVIPQVTLSGSPAGAEMPLAAPGADQAFAAFERMAALMDQQAATMMQQVVQMPGFPAAVPGLPPGVSGYSVVTTVSNGHACTRSTEVRYTGRGLQPQTVSSLSGDCDGGSQTGTAPAGAPASSEPAARAHTIRVRYDAPALRHSLVRQAFYQRGQNRAD